MWEFRHAVDCRVGRDFAWRFWTDVRNWAAVDPALESIELHGPFAAGTAGVTRPRGLDPAEWRLVEVRDRAGAVIEIPAPGAVVRFHWTFEDRAGGGTRITQRVSFEGERAGEYAQGSREELEQGIPLGMQRLAEAMEGAAREQGVGLTT